MSASDREHRLMFVSLIIVLLLELPVAFSLAAVGIAYALIGRARFADAFADPGAPGASGDIERHAARRRFSPSWD
jgi:hypothetical protein